MTSEQTGNQMGTDPAPPRPSTRRLVTAWAVGVGALVILLAPLAFTLLFAVASFSGCLGECAVRSPQPVLGLAYSLLALAMLVFVVSSGFAVGSLRRARFWRVAAVSSGVLLVAVVVTALATNR